MFQTTVEEFRYDLFIPRYRPIAHGDWALRLTAPCIVTGYWTGPVLVTEMATLIRRDATWMSMTPFELESQEIGVRLARGHVLICGLGLGWSAAVSALNNDVTAVTVVERDEDVVALHQFLRVFEQLPVAAQAKIRIQHGDAFEYHPEAPVDLLMPDIWLPLVSDGRVEEVRRMQANIDAKSVYFWGQEMEIARHAARAGQPMDHEGVRATIAEFALPLLGPELADYPERIALVAKRWMYGRWFDGVEPNWL